MKWLHAASLALLGLFVLAAPPAPAAVPVPAMQQHDPIVIRTQAKSAQKNSQSNAAAEKQRQAERAKRNAVKNVQDASRKAKQRADAAQKNKDAAARKAKEEAARKDKEREEAARRAKEQKDKEAKETAARAAREREEAMRKCAAAGRKWTSEGRCEATATDTPRPACPSGQQRDPKNPTGPCIAVPSTPPACARGQYRDPQNPTGPCIASRVECAQGTAPRRAGGDCEPLPGTPSCPAGQKRDYGGYCVCSSTGKLPERDGRCGAVTEVPPRACPEGTYRDPRNATGACIPYGPECPPGMMRRGANSPCEPVRRADPALPAPDRPCPTGSFRNRQGDCEFPRVEPPPRTAQPERPSVVPLPVPLPVPTPSATPITPPALVPASPELAGLCKGKPGTGRQDDVVLMGRKEIDTTRGAHEITYGSRQRKLVPVKDLPGAVGAREWDGQFLHADAYASLPPRPSSCKGRTDEGYELRIVDVPMQNGGTAPACVVYCRTGDTPPRPPVTTTPGTPAVSTVAATPAVQPYRPAVETVYARPQTEPRRPAVPTLIATPAPERRRPAVPTLIASPSGQPKRPAVATVKASPATIPARPAVETVKAQSIRAP